MTGVIIEYSSKEIAYELNYHYVFGKLFCITEKNKCNVKKYNFLQIFFAKFKTAFTNNKIFNAHSLNDFMLVKLFDNLLIY